MLHGHKHIYNEPESFAGSGFPLLPEHGHTMCLFTSVSPPPLSYYSLPLSLSFFSDLLPPMFLHSSEITGAPIKRLSPPLITTHHDVWILLQLLEPPVVQERARAAMEGAEPTGRCEDTARPAPVGLGTTYHRFSDVPLTVACPEEGGGKK